MAAKKATKGKVAKKGRGHRWPVFAVDSKRKTKKTARKKKTGKRRARV